ncbi:RDD family protein [Motilibacter deserti]|uniref:RDD family protein n=1 Tax=Motilibacter deserti TaxID=2714956 RepID=UPI002F2B300D
MPDDLVTGEAVVLELRPATFASRALALLIDFAVQFALLSVTFFALGLALAVLDPALGVTLVLLTVVALLVGYPVAFETLTRGRSLGKMALGLRVVRDDGGPEQFRQALVRGLVGFGEFFLTSGAAALISSLASANGKRIGDHLAGTLVIRERVPQSGAPVAALPPALAGWAAGLELSALPDALALEARAFLGRARQLHPAARRTLGVRLADEVRARITPGPPPGIDPESYLSAVLAERRRRELARMQLPGHARPGAYAHPTPYAQPGAYAQPQPQPGPYGQPLPSPPAPTAPPARPTPPPDAPFAPPG